MVKPLSSAEYKNKWIRINFENTVHEHKADYVKKIIYLRAIVITALKDAHFREGSLQANPLIKRSYISTTVI